MRNVIISSCMALNLFIVGPVTHAQTPDKVKEAVDLIVVFCVAGGKESHLTLDAKAEGGLAFKKIGGNANAEISFSKKEAVGLVDGLRSEMSKVSGEQATEARNCMKPYIDRILDIVLEKPPAPTDSLKKGSLLLPKDGVKMNNARVGPFCCTGTVASVVTIDDSPIGYIYFFGWKGQAYNVGSDSIVPEIVVSVSGQVKSGQPPSDQPVREIVFSAGNLVPQSTWVRVGQLEYRVTLTEYRFQTGPDSRPYFLMNSLRARVDVHKAGAG